MWSWFIFRMARQICWGAEQSVLCSVPRSATRCGTDGLKQLKVNWVQWKWICLKFWGLFFFFFLTGLLGETDFLLKSQTVWFLSLLTSNMAGTTASYVFVKYLNRCQNKSVILISAVIFSTQTSFKIQRVLVLKQKYIIRLIMSNAV